MRRVRRPGLPWRGLSSFVVGVCAPAREEEREKVTTLRDIPVGSSCTVKALTGTGAVKRRIMDMGLTKGAKVKVVKVAPLGDPLQLNVRGYELSVRKDEAERVEVEPE